MEPRDVTMKMVNMKAGGDIDTEVFEWCVHTLRHRGSSVCVCVCVCVCGACIC